MKTLCELSVRGNRHYLDRDPDRAQRKLNRLLAV
jgi:hypothetical protein